MIQLNNFKAQPSTLEKMSIALAQLKRRGDLGFIQLPNRDELWVDAQNVGASFRKRFSQIVIIGIGGSSLGGRTLVELFQEPVGHHQILFLDNVDPLEFERVLSGLRNLEQTGWILISKSGGTIETLVGADFVRQHYEEKGLNFYSNVHVVSENKPNPLTKWAQEHQVAKSEIPVDVGGRFSVLTPAGMILASYLGVNLDDIRRGAAEAVKADKQLQLACSQIWDSFQSEKWITVMWSYSSLMRNFGLWWQQLWAESLAKKVNRKGQAALRVSTPISGVGACDQHSILQQVMEGAQDKLVLFIINKGYQGYSSRLQRTEFGTTNYIVGHKMGELLNIEAMATCDALEQNGIMTATIEISDLSPQTIGYLLMFWQLVIGTLGEALDIDAFNQPGVELGKRLARDKFATK